MKKLQNCLGLLLVVLLTMIYEHFKVFEINFTNCWFAQISSAKISYWSGQVFALMFGRQ